MKRKAKIGFFAIGLNVYWKQFEGLEETVMRHSRSIEAMISGRSELVSAGLVDSYEKAAWAGLLFQKEDVDLVFCYCATYSPSSNVLPVFRNRKVPVVVLNLQSTPAIDYAKIHDIGTWLGDLSCAGAPEVTAVLLKSGIRFDCLVGSIEKDPYVVTQIEEWCTAANAARSTRYGKIGLLGHAYPGMMDLYVDETRFMNSLGFYSEFLELHQIKNALADVTEAECGAFGDYVKSHFELQVPTDTEDFEKRCRIGAAVMRMAKETGVDAIAHHYAGEETGEFSDIIAPINVIFSVMIDHGITCCVEGDEKTTAAMLIMKLLTGCGATAELYSMDFEADNCLFGHSGSSDMCLSAKKPILKYSAVFHGKTGGGYLTQFFIDKGPVTFLALSEDQEGNYRLIVAEGESVEGDILTLGDTNTRVTFDLPIRDFLYKWCMAGPSHHCAMSIGHHASVIKKFALIRGIDVYEIK